MKRFVLPLGLASAVTLLTASPALAILNNYVTHGDCSPARIENSQNITFNCVINDLPLTDIISSGDVETLTGLLDDGLSPEALLSAFGVGPFENTPGRRFFTAVPAELLPGFLEKLGERLNLNNAIATQGDGKTALFWMAVQAGRRDAILALAEAGVSPFAPFDSDGGLKRGRNPQSLYPLVYMVEDGAVDIDDAALIDRFAAMSPAFPDDEGEGYWASEQKKHLSLQNRVLGRSARYQGREVPDWSNVGALCEPATRSDGFDWCERLGAIPLSYHDTYDLNYDAQRNFILLRENPEATDLVVEEFTPDAIERLTADASLLRKIKELLRTPENLDRSLRSLQGMALTDQARKYIESKQTTRLQEERTSTFEAFIPEALANGVEISPLVPRKLGELLEGRYDRPVIIKALHEALAAEYGHDAALQLVIDIYQLYDPDLARDDVTQALAAAEEAPPNEQTAAQKARLDRAVSLVTLPVRQQIEIEAREIAKNPTTRPSVAGNDLSDDMWTGFSDLEKGRLLSTLTHPLDDATREILVEEYGDDAREALLTPEGIRDKVLEIRRRLPIDNPRISEALADIELTAAQRAELEPEFSESEATLRLIGLLNIRDGYAFFLTQSNRRHANQLGMAAISGQGTKHFLHAYEDDCLNEASGNYDQFCWRPTAFTQDPFDERRFQLGPFEDFYVAGDARID